MELRVFCQQFAVAVTRHVKENWGFPFIVGFLVLLLSAAVLLAAGYASTAEIVANIAYFALAAGVLLELACLRKK